MPNKLKALLRSRRFWAATVGVVGVVASEYFGITLDTDQLIAIAVMVSSWIFSDTVRPTE